MAERRLVQVAVSVTTLDRDLARTLEPRAPTPAKRLAAIRALSEAGVPTAVMAAPMIPALNDGELERILEAAAEAGARRAGCVLLRLPLEIKDLFAEWLATHAPAKAKHVLNLRRALHGRVRHPHARPRRLRRPAGQAFSPGLRAAWPECGPARRRSRARFQPLPPAAAPGRSARLALTAKGEAPISNRSEILGYLHTSRIPN